MAQLTFAQYYFSAAVDTTLSAATPAKAAGTTTLVAANGFTHTNNRMTCTDSTSRKYLILAAISCTKSGGSETDGSFHIYKNGTLVTGSTVSRTLANTSDEGAMAVAGLVDLVNTDYVELWVESANGDDVRVESGTVTAVLLG